MTTTEEAQTRALENSAMACIARGKDYWWTDCNCDPDALRFYAVRVSCFDSAIPPTPRESVPCADYDAMVAECVARNRAAVEAAGCAS